MPKVTDLDELVLTFDAADLGTSADFLIDTDNAKIQTAPGFNLDADGLSMQAFYSALYFNWQYRVKYEFDDATTVGPGAGGLRLNNATISSVTNIFVNETDASSTPRDRSNILGTIEEGQTIEVLLATSVWNVDVSARALFEVSGEPTDNGTHRTIPVDYISHTGSFSDGANVLLSPVSPFAGFDFPIEAISANSGEYLIQQSTTSAWDFADSTTRDSIRDGAWALISPTGEVLEEWANLTSLGTLPANLQPFYWQVDSTTATTANTVQQGFVNQVVQIFGGPNNGDFDRRDFLQVAAKQQGQTPVLVDILTELALPTLTARIFAFPLSTQTDLKITVTDEEIDANSDGTADVAPYDDISISWGTANVDVGDGDGEQPFNRAVIDAGGATLQEVHEWAAWLVRQDSDVDPGAGTRIGALEPALTQYQGDRLITSRGVAIVNFTAIDVNNVNSEITFTDSNNISRDPLNPDFISQFTILFNDVLVGNSNAEFWVYLAEDFGTVDNELLLNSDGDPVTGLVNGQSSIVVNYDYDTNTQKDRTPGTNTDIVIVAIGAAGARWFKVEGTITRSTTIEFRLISQIDRNYVDAV